MASPDTNNALPPSNERTPGSVSPHHDLEAAKKTAAHDVDAARQRAVEDVQHLKHEAEDQLHAAGEKAKSFAGEQKDMVAGQLDGLASAISKVAGELDQNEQAMISGYARDLAGGLERISDTVKERDTDELMGMAQDFGRTQPVAFLGAAALAGFVASRFAMASSHRRDGKSSSKNPGQSSLSRTDDTYSGRGNGNV